MAEQITGELRNREMSISTLSTHSGVSRAVIHKLIRGEAPSLTSLMKIAWALSMEVGLITRGMYK